MASIVLHFNILSAKYLFFVQVKKENANKMKFYHIHSVFLFIHGLGYQSPIQIKSYIPSVCLSCTNILYNARLRKEK